LFSLLKFHFTMKIEILSACCFWMFWLCCSEKLILSWKIMSPMLILNFPKYSNGYCALKFLFILFILVRSYWILFAGE
jgi:hypothetical protein